MKVTLLCDDKIKIKFEPMDLAKHGLTFDALSYSSPPARLVMKEALRLAKEEVGFESGGKLFIEAFPASAGGCVVTVTRLSEKVAPALEQSERAREELYCFERSDDLLAALAALPCLSGREAFLADGRYYIFARAPAALAEYARTVQILEYTRSILGESGKRIIL